MSHSYALRRLLNFLVELFRDEASEAGLDLSDGGETKNKIKTSLPKIGLGLPVATEKLGQFNRPHAGKRRSSILRLLLRG